MLRKPLIYGGCSTICVVENRTVASLSTSFPRKIGHVEIVARLIPCGNGEGACVMNPSNSKFSSLLTKSVAILAAASLTMGVGVSANANGFHGGFYGGHGGFHKSGFVGSRGFSRSRGFSSRRGFRRGGGGKGAAIALGVIGGAILLSEAARADERRRYSERRYEDRYRDRYDSYRGDGGSFERGYEEGLRRGREESGNTAAGGREPQLEGAGTRSIDGGPEPIRYSAADAFRTCTKHARRALSDRGFILSAPASPETAEDQGGAWIMTANVQAANNRGESWNRALVCEADADRVYRLELI